ncbi:MAG: ribonuclease III [Clostridia bacterium]|nr:ribonuclease III [Clostridia bacterium]
MELSKLEDIIGYRFRDRQLLQRAVTHSSYANEHLGSPSEGNERLEFLGDAVLGACVGLQLYNRYQDKEEGYLTKMRASIVCERSLGNAGRKLGINAFLLLSRGEESGGGRERVSIIADCMEAIIGAAYLDGGFDAANAVVKNCLGETAHLCEDGLLPKDAKTTLQEVLSHRTAECGDPQIRYEITAESGPDHAKVFTAEVSCYGRPAGSGQGKSKKEAEQHAAAVALEALKAKR